MRFTFTEDQALFQQAVRDMLAKECPPAEVRAYWTETEPSGPTRPEARPEARQRSRHRWARLAELGVIGLLVPPEHGGLGMDEVDLVLLLEETGRVALPEPVVETAVACRLLAEVASNDEQARWLPAVAAGEAVVSVGLDLAGRYVVDADVADLLILQHGDEVHAVEPAKVELTAQPSVDHARRVFSVAWTPSAATRLTGGTSAAAGAVDAAFDAAFDRGALGLSAQLLGLADHMIEITAEYARQREQFGQPIGSFQAVKHLLADALLRLEFARPAVYRAAWSVARHEPTRARDVSMAKAYASEAAQRAARVALQVHGAIGYTWEHDLHLWMKRAWVLAAAWGDAGWHRERVATWLLGPPDPDRPAPPHSTRG